MGGALQCDGPEVGVALPTELRRYLMSLYRNGFPDLQVPRSVIHIFAAVIPLDSAVVFMCIANPTSSPEAPTLGGLDSWTFPSAKLSTRRVDSAKIPVW